MINTGQARGDQDRAIRGPADVHPDAGRSGRPDRGDDFRGDAGQDHRTKSPGDRAEQIVFLRGKVDKRRETPGVIVNDLFPIADAMPRLTRWVRVQIDQIEGAADLLNELKPILAKHKGNCQTSLTVPATGSKRATIKLDRAWSVRPTTAMKEELELRPQRPRPGGFHRRRNARAARASQPPLFEGAETPVPMTARMKSRRRLMKCQRPRLKSVPNLTFKGTTPDKNAVSPRPFLSSKTI